VFESRIDTIHPFNYGLMLAKMKVQLVGQKKSKPVN
jgi:hypothetical protein